MSSNFYEKSEMGKAAEAFVTKHQKDIMQTSPIYAAWPRSEEHIEGKDGLMMGIDFNKGGFTRLGSYEVKGINSFLSRDNDISPLGSLGFELWHEKNLSVPGWVFDLLPETKEEKEERKKKNEKPKHHTPEILIYVLYEDWKHKVYEPDPFAVISFEWVPLFNRISEMAKEFPFCFHKNYYPKWEEMKGKKAADGKTCLIKNMWHVPMEYIEDLAEVTMVGNQMPVIKRATKRTPEEMTKRYENLFALSLERRSITP